MICRILSVASALCFYSVVVVLSFFFTSFATAQFDTVINLPEDQTSIGGMIGSDTQLNIHAGGIVEQFFDAGEIDGSSTNVEVNLLGGSIGTRFDSFGARVNIVEGQVGDSFDARFGSVVTITGGEFGSNFDASDSLVSISGGTFGGNFDVCESTVNISGGSFGTGFFVLPDTIVNISGGIFSDDFRAFPNSLIFFYGDDFTIDGEPIKGLVAGETLEIKIRNGATLAGELLEGTSFSFVLNDIFVEGEDFVSDSATISVTILDQILVGDINRDGNINLLDIAPFIDTILSGEYQLEADLNQDGSVNLLDVLLLIDLILG